MQPTAAFGMKGIAWVNVGTKEVLQSVWCNDAVGC